MPCETGIFFLKKIKPKKPKIYFEN